MSYHGDYNLSGQGGDAKAGSGTWRGNPGAPVTGGSGTGGDAQFRNANRAPDGRWNLSGKGGNATGNAGGAAKGGDGKGGSMTFG